MCSSLPSGAIGSFYWAGGIKENMPDMPVLTAMKNTFIYHMGSIAFGSLIIAIVQFIRYLDLYLSNTSLTPSEGKPSPIFLSNRK